MNATPFGGPVVPDVYRIVARSSGPTGANVGTSASPFARPVSRKDLPPDHLAADRRIGAAERDDRHPRRELVETFHHGRGSHEQEFRTAPAQHVVEVLGRRRRVQRNADAADEPDRDIHDEVARAVRPDDRDPGPGPDAHRAERRHRGGDLVPNLRRRPNGPAAKRVDVDEADGQTPTRQSEQDLLVDGAIGTMQEAAGGRVFQQGRQVVGQPGTVGPSSSSAWSRRKRRRSRKYGLRSRTVRPPTRSPIGRNTGEGSRTPRCFRAHRRAKARTSPAVGSSSVGVVRWNVVPTARGSNIRRTIASAT